MNDLARELVAELEPSTGWWKSDTEETLVEAAEAMLEHMDADTTEEVLSSVVGALQAEYGE